MSRHILTADEVKNLLFSGFGEEFRSLAGILNDASILGAMAYYKEGKEKYASRSWAAEAFSLAQGMRLTSEQVDAIVDSQTASAPGNMLQMAASFGYDNMAC